MFNEPGALAHLAGPGDPTAQLDDLADSGCPASATSWPPSRPRRPSTSGPTTSWSRSRPTGARCTARAGPDPRARLRRRVHPLDAAAVWGEHLAGVSTDATLELTERDRNRIFNLGYYTWVEQQGTPVELFERRRHQEFWRELRA